ncbi:MAG TPA: acetate--CoA ligase family protein [Alphaproteobacteria bacterium]|nr:acetate--CoA ligase family protein [Alphaproteobacteria bacterium]
MKTGTSLASFLAPAALAVVGASPDTGRIRGALLAAVLSGGYGGRVFPVNPSYREIAGLPCFPTLAAIGEPVDLALIAIPAAAVPAALEDCAAQGVSHAVILSSGFAEGDAADTALEARIKEIARRTGLRVCGPNAEGFHNELARLTATFSPAFEPKAGEVPLAPFGRRIGVVAQSGGIGFSFFNRGRALGLAFGALVSTGNEADLTASEFFEHMARDSTTAVILLFIEGARDPERFVAAARAAAEAKKPVVMIKIGRTRAGARAAASHTASMAGWFAAYEAVARSTGMMLADDPDEALALAALLATSPPPKGNRVAVVTVSGGAGAWMADALAAEGFELPELKEETRRAIAQVIPSYGSARNPVDITAQAVHSGGLMRALELLHRGGEVDAIVVTASLARENRMTVDVDALARLTAAGILPVLFYSYTLPSALARKALAGSGVVIHTGLVGLAKALSAALEHSRFRLPQHPPAPSNPKVAAELRRQLAGPGRTLCEYEAKLALAAYGLALPPERLVRDAGELRAAAEALGYPLALKLQSPALPHKSEAGGVRLGIADENALFAAHREMLDGVRRLRPALPLHGVLMQRMAPRGVEMILGVVRDKLFGPVVMVGAGGIMTELFADASYRLAPVDRETARAMLSELKCAALLGGFRGAPAADGEALVQLIVRISEFAADFRDCVSEIDINPVIVHAAGAGCTIVDALLVTGAPSPSPSGGEGSHAGYRPR